MRRTKGTARLFPGLTWKYEFHMISLEILAGRPVAGKWGCPIGRFHLSLKSTFSHHLTTFKTMLHKYDIWTLARQVWRDSCQHLLLLSVFSLFLLWMLLIIQDTQQLRWGCLLYLIFSESYIHILDSPTEVTLRLEVESVCSFVRKLII